MDGWNDLRAELPPVDVPVLCVYAGARHCFVGRYLGQDDEKRRPGWYQEIGMPPVVALQAVISPTHWRPLPEPPPRDYR